MTAGNMPAAEVHIDAALVHTLLRAQLPALAGEPLRLLAHGWDNVIYRLGTRWVVRLPRRSIAAALIEHEQRWLAQLAVRLPLAVPQPFHCGTAGDGFPWPWSVCPWLEGTVAAAAPFEDPQAAAAQLGAFLVALHQPAPGDAPFNPYRGVPLAQRGESVDGCIGRLASGLDVDRVRAVWGDALAAAPWPGPPLWVHGDLHPANLLVRDGRLSAVIDFGDLTAGDPATDLAAGWMLFDADGRDVFRHAYGAADESTWRRARGWALTISLAMLANSADNPLIGGIGQRTLRAVLG